MCKGSSGSNTTTTTTQPPPQVLQAYQNVVNQATNVAGQPLNQYSGPMVQGFTPDQQTAFGEVENSQGIANPYINAAAQYAGASATPINVPGGFSSDQLSGLASSGLGLSNNAVALASPTNFGTNVTSYLSPYTQNVVNATQAEFNNQNQQQNQQIIGNAAASGAWGGDRAAVAQGIAAGQEQLAQAPVIAGLEQQGFSAAQGELNTQQGLQQQAAAQQLGLFSGQQQAGIGAQEATGWLGNSAGFALGSLGNEAQSSALTGAQALYSLGSQQQQLGQEQLNIPYEQFLATQAYPYQTTGWLANVAEGIGGASGGTGTTTTPGASVGSQILGAGLAGTGILGATGAFGNSGWLTGASNGATAAADYATAPSELDYLLGSAQGGRISRGFAPGGAIPLVAGGIEDPSVNFIPMPSAMQGGMMNQFLHQPVTTQSSSGGGADPTSQAIGDALIVAKLATMFARGGHVTPHGFAPGGSATAPVELPGPAVVQNTNDPGALNGYLPAEGRPGISIPQLTSPSTAAAPSNVPAAFTTNYSPPPVSSLPYTSTTYPAGFSGSPTTTSVQPVQTSSGQWLTPTQAAAQQAQSQPQAAANSPQWLTSLYQQYLGRAPDPSGIAYYSNMSPSQVTQSLLNSAEYAQRQATLAGGSGSASAADPSVDIQSLLSSIPGYGMAEGGTVRPDGFRAGFDGGGMIDNAAGAFTAGAPASGGNPNIQNYMQRLLQLPPEKLQEFASRVSPGSPQGQIVQRALQVQRMNPQAANQATQQPQAPTATGSTAPAGFSLGLPMMAGDGRARFAGGGDADEDPVMTEGLGAAVPGPSGFAVPTSAPPATDDIPVGDSGARNPMRSPWMTLAAIGSGMLAGNAPHVGQALGQGLNEGLKFAEQQQQDTQREKQQQQQADYQKGELAARGRDADLAAQRLSAEIENQKATHGEVTRHNLATESYDQGRLKIEGQNADTEAEREGAYETEMKRGYWEPVRALTTADGKPVTDENGTPQGIWVDRYTGNTKQMPLQDPAVSGRGGGTGQSVSQWKYNAWLAIHPDDPTGALDFVAGHRQMTPADALKAGYQQAAREMLQGPDADARAREVSGQLMQSVQPSAGASPQPAAGGAPPPLGSRAKPLVPKTQQDIDDAQPGTFFQTPNGVMQKPFPQPPQQ